MKSHTETFLFSNYKTLHSVNAIREKGVWSEPFESIYCRERNPYPSTKQTSLWINLMTYFSTEVNYTQGVLRFCPAGAITERPTTTPSGVTTIKTIISNELTSLSMSYTGRYLLMDTSFNNIFALQRRVVLL